MKIKIRKIGKSSGVILPTILLKKLDLSEGDIVKFLDEDGRILIEKTNENPKFTLTELLKQCDEKVSVSSEIKDWNNLTPIGLEGL